jgi:hypothetical protein
MKTFIIASILTVGVLLQPKMAPTGYNIQSDSATTIAAIENQALPQTLPDTEMNAIVGVGATCSGEIDKNGTSVYYTCCASLWIFRVCVSVYLGEVPAPLTAQ